jgi:hypothetical protein
MVMEATKRTYQKHKTEYKITIKHYFNKAIKEFDNSIKQVYPIYIQVTYKSKNTKFRSRIKPISCSKVDKGELGLNDLKELIIRDTALIESLINEYNNHNIVSAKDERFDITDLVSLYRNDSFNLANFIDYCLRLEIVELIESNTDKRLRSIYDVKPLILLDFYSSQYPFLKSIREKFNSDIWIFDIYLEQINNLENYKSQHRLTSSEESKIKITDFPRNKWTLTLQDFKDGYAQKLLLDYFDNSLKMKEIFLDIETLILKHGKNYFENCY